MRAPRGVSALLRTRSRTRGRRWTRRRPAPRGSALSQPRTSGDALHAPPQLVIAAPCRCACSGWAAARRIDSVEGAGGEGAQPAAVWFVWRFALLAALGGTVGALGVAWIETERVTHLALPLRAQPPMRPNPKRGWAPVPQRGHSRWCKGGKGYSVDVPAALAVTAVPAHKEVTKPGRTHLHPPRSVVRNALHVARERQRVVL
jgi:hypothetical protein